MSDLLLTSGRTAIIYVVTLAVVRMLGKREIGAMTAFDFIVALMIGEVVDEMIFGNVPMIKGFVAMATIGLLHYLNSWLSFKSQMIDRITGAEATVLIRNGKVIEEALARERMNHEELEGELRINGIEDPADVKLATLEQNGEVSVIKRKE